MVVTNSLSGGGAERSMNLLCNEYTKRGWPVSLVPINSGKPDLVIPTCEIFPLDRKWKGSFMNTIVAFWKFNKVVNSWQPDVIVLNCDLPELYGALLFGKHKLVALEHASQPWGQRKLLGKIIRRILRFRRTTWAAVSSHLTIWPLREKPTTVLQNSVVLPKEVELKVTHSEIKRLVFVGRLSHEKRPDLALEIAKITNLELVIIGDGLMQEELEKKTLDESIKASFLGWVRDPWSKIHAGDLLIATSLFEGDGLIVIEGLAHRMPMLVVDIWDLRRFELPDRHYCADVKAFVSRTLEYSNKLEELVVPLDISSKILLSRTPSSIGDKWNEFLSSI